MAEFESFQIKESKVKESKVKESKEYLDKSYESVKMFGYNLFAQCICDKNPVLSPISAYLALAMAGSGADKTTKGEFYNILGRDMIALSDDMMNTFSAQGDSLILSIANSVWIDDKFVVHDAWTDKIKSLMDADIFRVSLASAETVNAINSWVAGKTHGLISNMVESPLTGVCALFNTIYFKGRWVRQFDIQDTCRETFYLNNGEHSKWLAQLWINRRNMTVQTDMMNMDEVYLDYIANEYAEGMILPYRKNSNNDPNMAFVALKPTGNGNIRQVYGRLTVNALHDILANREKEQVTLKLPKFNISLNRILNMSLFNMGLRECFIRQKADFTLMADKRDSDNLFINLVQQKAKIIVDERGTEAAAATEVAFRCLGNNRKLYFNEPFLYMIMDMDKELPLFIGILDNPLV